MTCHSEGDAGAETAQKIHDSLVKLDSAIKQSDDLLGRAERSGMEVGESQLAEGEARDHLTKARVELHAVTFSRVDPEIQAGLKVTQKTWKQGEDALAELQYRRKGLIVSVITIFCVVIGLFLMIRKLEGNSSN